MKSSILIQFLKQNGWQEIRQQGIHCILMHPKHANLISVPNSGDLLLSPEIVNDISREAGLKGRVHKIQWSPAGIVRMVKNIFGFNR